MKFDVDDIVPTITLLPNPDSGQQRQLFQAPCANEQAQTHYERTVQSKVDVDKYSEYLPNEIVENYEKITVWGTGNESAATDIRRGDVISFYVGDHQYESIAVVLDSEPNEALNDALWEPYERGLNEDDSKTWPYIIYLTDPIPVAIDSREFHRDLDYDRDHPLGFTRVAPHRVSKLISKHGDLETYFGVVRNTATEVTETNDKRDSNTSTESTTEQTSNPVRKRDLRPIGESPDRTPSNPADSQSVTYDSSPAEQAKSHQSHEDTLELLVNRLENQDYECFDIEGGSDLIATNYSSHVLQAEAKSLRNAQKLQIRKAIGQLAEYRYFDIERLGRFQDQSLTQALLFDREPTGRYREFVEALSSKGSHSILTFWIDEDGNLAGTEESLNQLNAFSE